MFVTARNSENLTPFAGSELYKEFAPDTLEVERPGTHQILLEDEPSARCSLWWRDVPSDPRLGASRGQKLGVIGHYAARNARAAEQLLLHACGILAANGCKLAVGPMNGNTWRRYRFVTERGEEPPFFLEPDHPESYPEQWRSAGFTALATYSSSLQTDLVQASGSRERILARIRRAGIVLRPLRMEAIEDELRAIYRVTVESFRKAFLYTPIPEAEFVEMYRAVLPYVRPELCIVAEADRLLGYSFTLPDVRKKERGETVDTVIFKTLAVVPQAAGRGLGSAMVDHTLEVAHTLGFKRAIHALMHEDNVSQTMSRRYRSKPIRRYALFAKQL
ncbi:MAG: GNAT family N-acetyltransferase [Trueperaceae bacterium]|nr:MAG: GNAT family N-acetyltransferase [Trueperaceae bacterium]